jgi:hypothetical protein
MADRRGKNLPDSIRQSVKSYPKEEDYFREKLVGRFSSLGGGEPVVQLIPGDQWWIFLGGGIAGTR